MLKAVTLTILIIVGTCIGNIASIYAVRAYDAYEDAKAVQQFQNWMQQQYTLYNAFPTSLSNAPALLKQSPATGAKRYDISLTTEPAATTTTYTLQAVPVTVDKNCGTLSITNSGLRAETGSKDVDYCWNK